MDLILNLIGVIGSIASIISLRRWWKDNKAVNKKEAKKDLILFGVLCIVSVGVLIYANSGNSNTNEHNLFRIESGQIVKRKPLFDSSSYTDEIIVKINGFSKFPDKYQKLVFVAFWKLSSGFETNWHISRRQVGNDLVVQKIKFEPSEINYERLINGIEMESKDTVDIIIKMAGITNEQFEKLELKWDEDNHGWGFDDLKKFTPLIQSNEILIVNK